MSTSGRASSRMTRVRIYEPGRPVRDVQLPVGTHMLGRSPTASIPITHNSVSKQHLSLRIEPDGRILAADLGSTRGTELDGRRLSSPAEVRGGSVLSLGQVRIELEGERPRPSTALSEPVGIVEPEELPTLEGELPDARPSREKIVILNDSSLALLGAPPSEADLDAAAQSSFLADLAPADREWLLRRAERVSVSPGGFVVREGELPTYLQIVLSGDVQLTRSAQVAGSVPRGSAVELGSVLSRSRSSHTAQSREGATLLRIPVQDFDGLLQKRASLRRYFERSFAWPGAERLRHLLREHLVDPVVVIELVGSLERRSLEPKELLSADGEAMTSMYIVDEGTLVGTRTLDGVEEVMIELVTGSFVGVAELLSGRPMSLRFRASGPVELLALDGELVRSTAARSLELKSLLRAFGPLGKLVEHKPEPAGEESPDEDDTEAPPLSTFARDKSPAPKPAPKRVSIRQHDEMDCGAACLSTIAHAYGRKVSLAYCRSLIHVTREGASMWSVVRAARQIGFQVAGVHGTAKALRTLHLPAILLLKYHFVVLFEINDKTALISDPAVGFRKLPIEDLERDWKGMTLLLRPTDELQQTPESAPVLWKYRVLLRDLSRPVVEILAASFLVFGLGLVAPLLTQVVFDKVLVGSDRRLLNVIVILAAVVAGFQTAVTAAKTHLTMRFAAQFDAKFSTAVYRHVLSLPLNYFMVRRLGDLLTRLREIQRVRTFLTGESLSTVIQVTSIVLYVFVLYLYHPSLAAWTVSLIPLIGATSILTSKKLTQIMHDGFPAMVKARGLLVEHVRGVETVKALQGELASRWRWEEALSDELRNRQRIERMHVLAGTVAAGIEQLATTWMLYYAAKLAIQGDLSVGKAVATTFFVTSILGPVRTLCARWTTLEETKVALERIDDLVTAAAEPGQEPDGGGRLAGGIRFDDVWFQYGSDLSPWVLKGVSLEIKRGETVAFVGRSGSGKSTLVQLINRLYAPTRGALILDGTNATQLSMARVRGSVGMVMQDANLFTGTVFENITMGREDASMDLAVAAARVANAHGFISELDGGYHHVLADGGRSLSGGQRQRLSIARALYARPSILVLDEATSALDSESERAIVEAMKVFCRGRTSVVVAHRLSTILHADRIVMLEQGRVVEVGTHRELIARGGPYAQLFGAQLAL